MTTGRPRRTGWFDAVIARYATRVNGITDFFLTKLDVLSGLDKVPVCVAYDVDGTRHTDDPDDADRVPPRGAGVRVPRRLVGGPVGGQGLRRPAPQRQNYVQALEDMIGAPVAAIGTGPRRDQTLQLRPLLDR